MTRPVAVVTGAAGGLGQALVARLDRAGYDVVGVDLQSIAPVDGMVETIRGDISRSANRPKRAG